MKLLATPCAAPTGKCMPKPIDWPLWRVKPSQTNQEAMAAIAITKGAKSPTDTVIEKIHKQA
eukprot:scaffold8537_cov22-Prasinocladus_malaysianus.AAC.2